MRLTCLSCGRARSRTGPISWPEGSEAVVRDPWFGAPLWLQGPCAGHVLWAVNDEHLDYIERYVSADHRRDRSSQKLFNSALGEQFPKWMVVAEHRAAIAKTIVRLRERS
jgi:hypothetical protein